MAGSDAVVQIDPTFLRLTASAERTVEAEAADVTVVIAGRSLFYGNEALAKAEGVRDFVSDLRQHGFEDGDFQLAGVDITSENGLIAKASGASYTLKLTCRPVSRLSPVLGAVAGQKHIRLQSIAWNYGDAETLRTLRDELMADCLADVSRRARAIGEGLGAGALVPHHYEERAADPGEYLATFSDDLADVSLDRVMPAGSFARRRAAATFGASAPLDLGAAIAHRDLARFAVRVSYRLRDDGRSTSRA